MHCTSTTKLPTPTFTPSSPTLQTYSGSATILVGPSLSPRTVPRDLLLSTSTFFRAALLGPFSESATQTVHLPEDRADVFDYFVFWLYYRSLRHEAVDAVDPAKPAYFWLLHLYCLADKLGVEACKNQIVDKIAGLADETNSVPTPTDTWIVFETFGCQENNRLRRLVVDLFAWKRTDNLLDTHDDEWHPRFMRDLIVRVKREDVRGSTKPWTRELCRRYHEHDDGQSCRT